MKSNKKFFSDDPNDDTYVNVNQDYDPNVGNVGEYDLDYDPDFDEDKEDEDDFSELDTIECLIVRGHFFRK